ncbi:nicotinate-nucleotide--dimethylbenzimidazole phosphoribosyltransferase [Brevundimonas sp. MYb46]|uniref:nicotinate-nucleotide--dimethylbenzimidazole phosphoribosyltransferase n=1 Tax=unclassified Brevundimonas TaxID=2622653 RepID=UPI000CFD3E03|nr:MULTISPECIES: nicotinate-nucleotide--dimethylbenzimidazole phosphoribosyltransferase [unclassified Brevundimonas]PRA25864.1 nicotinate-nucleotide--dimethylbenzimidazole phosphoribosyltransferase [Brevundimonas sp. MYb27]PQZ75795.1 nicotinate-nucleotide--dimethylbenzimidazole phosphoribosyltransferase [Brevundimonas sp. MYb31]PRB18035.1 nicotinate-nucleotide--dimethylbenzimidazole phosphoribosyltransferase [Brevundimonas sp. MYb52]PRB36013.1 nicotinate-nucleotide--dimethylbenzimidazole phosph
MSNLTDLLTVPALDGAWQGALKQALDGKAKPPGALGRVEELALRLGLIQGQLRPSAARPVLLVFAGDHGLTRSGVAAFPSGVTVAMVDTLLAGKASANAFARVTGVEVRVIDAGVAADMSDRTGLVHAKIAPGTKDASLEPAMTSAQAEAALSAGARVAADAIADGADLIALGEMGIGNSAAAALLMHRLAPAPLDDCVGQGAGHSLEGMARKRAVLARAAARSDAKEPLEVLTQFGGFEIAMMAGALLGAARGRVPVMVDGFIGSAAALLAVRLAPNARDYCLFAHASAEAGHRLMLEALDAQPLLHLDMRLGEGTGALLAVPLVRAACALLAEVAELADVLEAAG